LGLFQDIAIRVFPGAQEQKRQGSPLPLSFIELSEVFARSVAIANYIKDLDLKTYYSLALPISKRLFRYLERIGKFIFLIPEAPVTQG